MSHFAYRDICAFDAGGDCGVAFFFLLSGFVCSLGYGAKIEAGSFHYSRFLWKRIKKLYPLHLLCLLNYLLLSHVPIDGKVLLNVLLLQSWVPDSDYYFACNSVSWYLSTLMFCYVMFPLLYRLLSWRLSLLVATICVAFYYYTPYDRVNAIRYVNPIVRLVDFYFGMVLCHYFVRRKKTYYFKGVEFIVLLLLVVSLAVYPYVDEKFRNAPLFWMVLIPLIWVFAQEKGSVSTCLKIKQMSFLGSLTMPIFLIHQMQIGIMMRRLPEMPAAMMLFVCVFLVLIFSWGVQIIFSRLIRY